MKSLYKLSKSLPVPVLPVLVFTAFAVLLLSCGPSQKASSSAAEKEIQPDGIAQLSIVGKIVSMDPVFAGGDLYSNTVANYALESLYEYDYYSPSSQLAPLLAEALPEVSEDNLTYTFKIKPGIYYYDPSQEIYQQNEREVKAQDFAFSLLRLADVAEKGKGFWLIDGFIQGLNEWRDSTENGGDYANPPEGIQVLDDYTLQIKLTKPYPQMIYVLTMNYTAPLPKEVYEFYGRDGLGTHMVGTGAYFLDPSETIDDNRYVFRPNPSYRDVFITSSDAPAYLQGQKLPLNGGLDIRVMEESAPQWLSFKQGGLDILSPGKDQFDQAVVGGEPSPEMKARGVRLIITPVPDLTYNFFNYNDPEWGPIMRDPVKGPKVRKAIQLAYDRKTVSDIQYNNRAVPAKTPIPPVFDGFADYKNPYNRFDVEAAKQLLVEAGYPDGKGLPVLLYEGTSSKAARDLFEIFRKYMEAIGIECDFSSNDWPTFSGKLDSGNFVYAGLGWNADYPDPQNFLQLLYGGNIGTTNYSSYQNPEFDKLYEESSVMLPSPERTAIYKKMVDIVTEDSPWILGMHRLSYAMVSPRIRDWHSNTFARGSGRYYQILK